MWSSVKYFCVCTASTFAIKGLLLSWACDLPFHSGLCEILHTNKRVNMRFSERQEETLQNWREYFFLQIIQTGPMQVNLFRDRRPDRVHRIFFCFNSLHFCIKKKKNKSTFNEASVMQKIFKQFYANFRGRRKWWWWLQKKKKRQVFIMHSWSLGKRVK